MAQEKRRDDPRDPVLTRPDRRREPPANRRQLSNKNSACQPDARRRLLWRYLAALRDRAGKGAPSDFKAAVSSEARGSIENSQSQRRPKKLLALYYQPVRGKTSAGA